MLFKNPKWINKDLYQIEDYNLLPKNTFDTINENLRKNISKNPEVSIIIPAWNEELNIIRCIDSLSKLQTTTPFEIIIVNNNSTDNTQISLNKLEVKNYLQPIQGCGPARQLGQEKALGKYILLADADCLYPPKWLDSLLSKLKQPKVICVYGKHSYIAESTSLRFKLFVYELLKELLAEIRQIKRPYLNAFGMSMGYLKEMGMKVGFVTDNTWGEDGRLAFDLMEYGKIVRVRSNNAKVWTSYRALLRDGSLMRAFFTRVFKEILRFNIYFKKEKKHDTKTSKNAPHSIQENIQSVKNKFKRKDSL